MDDQDIPHYEEILRLLDGVDGWIARIDPDIDHVRPTIGSPLCADDERTHPFQTSHAAWHALSHAVDPLHCLRSVLRDARAIHMYAPYALLRAALENASAAVWMLHPASRTERITRRLRLVALDVRSGGKAMQLLDSSARRPEAERVDELRDIAKQAGADPDNAVRRVGYGEIVDEAGKALAPGSLGTLFVWRLCSGITHGDFLDHHQRRRAGRATGCAGRDGVAQDHSRRREAEVRDGCRHPHDHAGLAVVRRTVPRAVLSLVCSAEVSARVACHEDGTGVLPPAHVKIALGMSSSDLADMDTPWTKTAGRFG